MKSMTGNYWIGCSGYKGLDFISEIAKFHHLGRQPRGEVSFLPLIKGKGGGGKNIQLLTTFLVDLMVILFPLDCFHHSLNLTAILI